MITGSIIMDKEWIIAGILRFNFGAWTALGNQRLFYRIMTPKNLKSCLAWDFLGYFQQGLGKPSNCKTLAALGDQGRDLKLSWLFNFAWLCHCNLGFSWFNFVRFQNDVTDWLRQDVAAAWILNADNIGTNVGIDIGAVLKDQIRMKQCTVFHC